ncbi:MAG: D-alanine--D-alanine ligase [Spirochaetales bacterium]|nr:D-alanine--D-alanine ligase [Spirochaetales bacterium]
MDKKLKVGVLFGGRSAEHEISLLSAKSIVSALDKDKYDPVLIAIDREGFWHLAEQDLFETEKDTYHIDVKNIDEILALIPGKTREQFRLLAQPEKTVHCDVVFPVLHGTYGEDGTMQGLLKIMNLPYVGPDVTGSASGMDKEVMKRLLKENDIPVADFLAYRAHEASSISYDEVKNKLGLPLFIKPANLGSSIGISKVRNEVEFDKGIREAFRYDSKLIIEEFIVGREIECAVLGNEQPQASLPGRVIPNADFYSYEAKYLDEKGAAFEIPAKLDENLVKTIQDTAVKTFKALCCEGMGRVDLFIREENTVIVNEINTIPGFTKISMYPKLWEISGLPYGKLVSRLIELAMERHERDSRLSVSLP